jgi:hypothetical protein
MKRAAIGVALLLAGGLGGWALRGRFDRASLQEVETRAFMLGLMTDPSHRIQRYILRKEPEEPPTPEERDAELRCILYDPEAIAAPATIRDVIQGRESWRYQFEVDTPRGAFTAEWDGDGVPRVGRKGELFGRPDKVQLPGVPARLDPAWFEPVGTMARLDKRPVAAR